MTRQSIAKKEKKLRLARNKSKSKKTINNATNNRRQLPPDLVSEIDRPTGNEHFTYKTRSFAGPSHQKLSNFLEQENADIAQDTNDYYQIIHNSFLLELMKQNICILCKSIWNGSVSVAKREGTAFFISSDTKVYNYICISGLYCSIVFTCNCSNTIKINTSKQCPKSSKRDINVRSVVGKFMLSNIIMYK